jgi:hypothetical protein
MNTLRFRALFGLIIWLGWYVHISATRFLPNTPEGMLIFHGSAAAVDLFLVYSAPRLLEGKLCDDTQNLCLASIIGNAVGWAFYLAYLPPVFYNTFMEILGYVQWARLFMVDDHDATNHLGSYLVRRSRFVGA